MVFESKQGIVCITAHLGPDEARDMLAWFDHRSADGDAGLHGPGRETTKKFFEYLRAAMTRKDSQ
jgi:hypothetical protein